MGVRNYLIEGLSATGKTTVCDELLRRGYQAVHGDRELRAHPETDEVTENQLPPIWDVAKVNALIANDDEAITFLCGGCRNSSRFMELLDGGLVLEVDDLDTVMRRIDKRVLADPSDWGGRKEEREIIMRLHHTKETVPQGGIPIDATAPIEQVVDSILRHCEAGA